MADKIMILASSPRKHGNTNTVTQWVIEGAQTAGATVECVDVANLKHKFNGCIACFGCQQSEKYECVVEDETADLLKRLLDYETLVFATPVFFFGPNAQLKLVLDRMLSHVKFDPETHENVKASGIVVQMQEGKYYTVWPFDRASREAICPMPTWSER